MIEYENDKPICIGLYNTNNEVIKTLEGEELEQYILKNLDQDISTLITNQTTSLVLE